MPNKTKQKNTLKVLKKIWEKKKAIWISHLTRQSFINSLSKQWLVLESELALKKYSVFQEATHSMSFSTLSFSPPYIKQHPSNLCLQCVNPPLPYPAVPTQNLVVSRTRPLNPVPRPPKKTVTTPLSLRIFSTMLLLMLFLKLVLYTQSLELYVNIFFLFPTLSKFPKNLSKSDQHHYLI